MCSGLFLVLGGAFVGYQYSKHHEYGGSLGSRCYDAAHGQRTSTCRRDVVTPQDITARLDAFNKRELEPEPNEKAIPVPVCLRCAVLTSTNWID